MEKMNNHPWADDGPVTAAPSETPEPFVAYSHPAPEHAAPIQPPASPSRRFPAGGKELTFGLLTLICGMLLCNFTLFGGFQLGFGIALSAYILCAAGYLLAAGGKLTPYSTVLLVLSLGIAAGYGRSDDGFVKFIMLLFLTVSINLGLCLIAGQNRRRPGCAGSIVDVFRTVFTMGYGQLPRALSGLFGAVLGKGSLFKKFGAIMIGLLIMLPVMAILLPLLIKADAAFEGMMKMMPEIDLLEITVTALFGVGVFFIMYTRGVALARRPKTEPVQPGSGRGMNKLTINTVLFGVCVIYLLYLISQLAYFIGGFAGILPEEYTLAEYARRGFFEMAGLCALNMGIIVLAMILVRKSGAMAPLSTRLLCLFVGLVTVFMVAAASAKMANYIGGYGLTRMRVMTQLIILFFGIAALTVSVNLFLKKPRYMPVLIVAALLLGGTAFWADVDTVVATYNVTAYQKGQLPTVDVEYLGTLSNGAIPQIAKLVDDADPKVAEEAKDILRYGYAHCEDFRDWNYTNWQAQEYVSQEESGEYYNYYEDYEAKEY